MAKVCLNHKEQPAVTMCHQCHKPICKSCVTVTPQGSFCSSECLVTNRKVMASLGTAPKQAKSKAVMLVLLVIVLGIIAMHFVARDNKALRSFDLIGGLLGYPADDPRSDSK